MKPITIEIDSRIVINKKDIKRFDISLLDVKREFIYPNPEFYSMERMGYFTGQTPREMTLIEADPKLLLFPRGIIKRLKDVLSKEDIPFKIVDKRISGTGPIGFTYHEPTQWSLDRDQLVAANQCKKLKQGIIVGPCASGKTEILLKAIADINEQTLVVVHTERILKDWVKTCADRFGVDEKEIGVYYGKAKRIGPITIGMVRSVLNLIRQQPDFVNRWGCFVMDEAHHAPASTFAEIVNSFPAKYRLAATATPKRKDKKEVLFYDAFGSFKEKANIKKVHPKILYEITDESLEEYNRIMPVNVVIVPTNYYYDLFRINHLKDIGFKKRERETNLAAVKRYDKEYGLKGSINTYTEMLDDMVRDEERNTLILNYLLREIEQRQVCLLLADRRELGISIQSFLKKHNIPVGRLMGGKDAKEQDKTVKRLMDRNLYCAVGTTIADEGMNIPILSRGFGCTPTATNASRLKQQIGRFKRKNADKTDAYYYYFWDCNVPSFENHFNLLKQNIGSPHKLWLAESFSKICIVNGD